MTDYKSIIESPFYEKANKYVEETGNNDCTLEAYIDGATEATKELEAQVEKQKRQLTEAKEIIKIMKHLLFDVWGYIDFPFEERVNKYLSEVEK